jgi:hypothetical protein
VATLLLCVWRVSGLNLRDTDQVLRGFPQSPQTKDGTTLHNHRGENLKYNVFNMIFMAIIIVLMFCEKI